MPAVYETLCQALYKHYLTGIKYIVCAPGTVLDAGNDAG